jgi:hypothetical protein
MTPWRKHSRKSYAGSFDVAWLVGGVVCACLAVTTSSIAQAPCSGPDCPEAAATESSRGIALGTGLRASSMSTSALAYSPAGLALGRLYHIEGNVDYIPDANGVALGAGVVDSSTSQLGAGIGLRGFLSGAGGWGGLDGRLGLAFPFSDAFSVGVAGRYITISGEDDVGDEVTLARGFTMDASFRIRPAEGFAIDLGAYNFIPQDNAYVPVELGTGLSFGVSESLGIGADFLIDFTTFASTEFLTGAGVEFLAGGAVPLRLGYRFDTGREIHAVTGGIGYTSQYVGLDLSLRQQVATGESDAWDDTLDTRVMGAIRYYVH